MIHRKNENNNVEQVSEKINHKSKTISNHFQHALYLSESFTRKKNGKKKNVSRISRSNWTDKSQKEFLQK